MLSLHVWCIFLPVSAVAPPTELAASQFGPSVTVSWTPPQSVQPPFLTLPYGYRIYYRAHDDYGLPQSEIVIGGTTAGIVLTAGSTCYNVSIQSLSEEELPSAVTEEVSTVGKTTSS